MRLVGVYDSGGAQKSIRLGLNHVPTGHKQDLIFELSLATLGIILLVPAHNVYV